jgi:hypothetical protein
MSFWKTSPAIRAKAKVANTAAVKNSGSKCQYSRRKSKKVPQSGATVAVIRLARTRAVKI